MLIILEYEVPAHVMTVDGDLAVSALLLAAVQQRLLLVQALVVVRDLPHLQQNIRNILILDSSTIYNIDNIIL